MGQPGGHSGLTESYTAQSVVSLAIVAIFSSSVLCSILDPRFWVQILQILYALISFCPPAGALPSKAWGMDYDDLCNTCKFFKLCLPTGALSRPLEWGSPQNSRHLHPPQPHEDPGLLLEVSRAELKSLSFSWPRLPGYLFMKPIQGILDSRCSDPLATGTWVEETEETLTSIAMQHSDNWQQTANMIFFLRRTKGDFLPHTFIYEGTSGNSSLIVVPQLQKDYISS